MNNSTIHCIYRIVCFATGKVYVGQTCDYGQRKRSHFSLLKRNLHTNSFLQRAFNKYGSNSFYMEIIERDVLPIEVGLRERYWISHFDSFNNGFNSTPGGDATTNCKKPCSWNGIEYESVIEASRSTGINVGTLYFRLRKGYKADADVPKVGDNVAKTPCTWNGVEYESIRDAARILGVSKSAMQLRISNGSKCDNDIYSNEVACNWDGVEYKSINAAARAVGIKEAAMRNRLKKGHKSDSDLKRLLPHMKTK